VKHCDEGHVDPEQIRAVALELVAVGSDLSRVGAVLRLPTQPPAADDVTIQACGRISYERRRIGHLIEESGEELIRISESLTSVAYELATVWKQMQLAIVAPYVPRAARPFRISPRWVRPEGAEDWSLRQEIDDLDADVLTSWAMHLCNGGEVWPRVEIPEKDQLRALAQRLRSSAQVVEESWSNGGAAAKKIRAFAAWIADDVTAGLIHLAAAEENLGRTYAGVRTDLFSVATRAYAASVQKLGIEEPGDPLVEADIALIRAGIERYRRSVPGSIVLAEFPRLSA